MQHDPDLTAPPNLDDVLAAPASQGAWRVRAWAAAVTVVAVVILSVLLFWPPTAQPASQASNAQVPSSYTFHLASNVTWASFTVTYANHRTMFAAHSAGYITLHTGLSPYQVHVTATAPPFTARQCRLTIPPANDDTCVLQPTQSTTLLAFAFGLTDLPPAQQHAVAALVASALQANVPATVIPAGGHYVLGTLLQGSYITTVPLATKLITKATPAKLILDSSCVQLCAAPPEDWVDNQLALWHVRLFVSQEWHYARASDGAFVGTTRENLVPHAISFDLNYDVGQATWVLAQSDGARTFADALVQPLCADGNGFVQTLYFNGSSTLANYSPNAVLEDHQLAGCLITLTAAHSGQRATFLWHTAQLYTVDAAAHAVEPALVQASPQDLAALN